MTNRKIFSEIQENLFSRLDFSYDICTIFIRLILLLKFVFLYTAAIEAKGLKPVLEVLKKLGGWPVLEGDEWQDEEFEWMQSVYKFRNTGYSVDYFFDFSIGIDLKNSTKRVLDVSNYS